MSVITIRDHLIALQEAVEEFEGNLILDEFGLRLYKEGFVTYGLNQIADQLNDALDQQSDET